MRLLSIGMLSVAASLATGPLVLAQTWPAGLNVAPVEGGRVGATVYPSSSRLEVSWTPPAEAPYRYILTLGESVTGTESSVEVVDTRAVVTGLKSGTTYTVALKACLDEACERSLDADVTGSGRTSEEYWQVQGSGNTFSRATKIVSDGNAARQFKIGYPTRTDWRWGGEPGTFMVITADFDAPCASEAFFNAAYAIWGGRRWVLQYDPSGCPKYMPEVQAPLPVHLGAARYKMYFSHNPLRRGAMSDPLRDLKPLQIIYADGGLTGEPGYVDFEDWEQVAQAREVHFLWPDGSLLELAHESQLDDYMIFMPTGNPSLQIMYSNMATPGSRELPFIGMAVLVNP